MNTVAFRRSSIIIAIGLAAGALPGRSLSADGKVLAGTACHHSGNSVGTHRWLTQGAQAIGETVMICGLFRDVTTNTNGLSDLEVPVTDPTTGSIVCDAVNTDRNGFPVKVVRRQSTRTGFQVLDWGGSVNVSSNKGANHVICSVPHDGIIHSVFYNEF